MIVEAKAVKKQCLSQYCQVVKLTATTVDQARFLAHLHRIIALGGGKVEVTDNTGNSSSFLCQPNDHLSPKVEDPPANLPVQG